jgi:hypothetical protein
MSDFTSRLHLTYLLTCRELLEKVFRIPCKSKKVIPSKYFVGMMINRMSQDTYWIISEPALELECVFLDLAACCRHITYTIRTLTLTLMLTLIRIILRLRIFVLRRSN